MDRGIPLRKESSESKLPAKLRQSLSPEAHLTISGTKQNANERPALVTKDFGA